MYSTIATTSSLVIARTDIRQGQAQLLVELVPSDLGEIVAAGIEEHRLQQGARRLGRRRVAGTNLMVDVDERRVLVDDFRIFHIERRRDELRHFEHLNRR